MKKYKILLLTIMALGACKSKDATYDASGTFEAVETIVAAEASGTINELNLEEGATLQIGQVVGTIDSVQLFLKKKQLQAQINAVLSRKPNVASQTAALYVQLQQAERERDRTANLVKTDAATPKQLDDANAQVAVIKKQIAAQQSTLNINTSSLNEEAVPLQVQIEQLNDQLKKCKIVNEINGTVLTKYAEAKESTMVGKPLYKIAELNVIILRAYLTNTQLQKVKVGQPVKVLVDEGKDAYKTYEGKLEWISSKAEFTPKTIQTKDERANLVYAVKVRVKNDGYLKIGMYADLKL
jgi:HlyD family secretion protein